MSTTTILLTIYIASVVSLLLFLVIQKVRGKSTMKVKENLGMTIAALILAPISWILGIIVVATDKTKVSEPKPVPKKLRAALKKDRVVYDGKIMSIAEVNRLTRKKYKLEDIYGKKYVAALTESEIAEFDDDDSELNIMDKVRKDGDFEIVHKFAKARMSGKLDNVKELFAEDACLVTYEREIFYGVDDILKFWKDRYESSLTRNVKFNFRIDMCMFYNGPALFERPERYASMIVTFKIDCGKIKQMLLAPEYLSSEYQYYGGFREAPYTLEYFKPFLKESLEPRAFRIPCPSCGRLSENLDWYTFNTKDSHDYHYYGGTASVCPHCKKTVEIFPIERLENEDCDYSHLEENEDKNNQTELKLPKVNCFSFTFTTPLAGTKYLNSLDDADPIENEANKFFDESDFIKNSWGLIEFARMKGQMKLATATNKETGAPFKFIVFISSEDEKTIVNFSTALGELTSAEIVAQKNELKVIEYTNGCFSLEKENPKKKNEDSQSWTEKRIVAEFNSRLIMQIYSQNRPLFDEICYCYKKAYDDGIVEAGNNLAIMYINYADLEDKGMALLKECAEKGCANAASNYFTCLWGNQEDYSGAIKFALSCKTPSIPLYWNIVALYLNGKEIKGNTLDVDVEKAKHYLKVISTDITPDGEDESKIVNKAQCLLNALENLDPLGEFARQYIESTLPQCIQNAENDRRVDSVIKRELPHLHIPNNTSLWLRLADDHNGHGDISEFILRYGKTWEDLEIARESEVLHHIEVDKSQFGVWEAYLFSKARHLLPTFWHGGYNRETVLFNIEDFKRIPSQKGRALDVILRGDNLKPKVYFEGDTAFVECCYWSEWGGLFREKCRIEYNGNKITSFERVGRDNIYMYDCGIRF